MRFNIVLVLASIAIVTGSPVSDGVPANGTGLGWTIIPPWFPHYKPTTPATTTSTPSTTTPSTTTTSTPATPPSTPPTPPSTSTSTTTTPTPPTTPPTTSPSTTTTTTPSPAPIPTPTPSPAPKHDYGNWTVAGTNGTCIMLQAVLTVNVKYPMVNETEGHASIAIPNNATSNGSCADPTMQVLDLAWGLNLATLRFNKLNASGQYSLASVKITLIPNNESFVNISQDVTKLEYASSSSQFITPLGYSYQCSVQKDVSLVNATASNTTSILGSLDFTKMHLQAFMGGKETKFDAPQDCDEDASDMVPIVVGCALAALIVVILGVYVWGRRNSRSTGYLSM